MALAYKNFSKDVLLTGLRNVRIANSSRIYSSENNMFIVFNLRIDLEQIALQADLFARELMTHQSKFEFKRFLGSYQLDWMRLLHETYVYDRIKCIYYGINANNMIRIPSNTFSFPGNIILMRLLICNNFQYNTSDNQQFSLFTSVKYKNSSELFDPVFEQYPDLKQGMSDDSNIVSYVNSQYETIMNGLYNAKEYLKAKDKSAARGTTGNNNNTNAAEKVLNGELFQILKMNDPSIEQFVIGNDNPLTNSFLSEDGKRFYFILPYDKSTPDAMRNNESLFITRALGFRSDQVTLEDNSFYSVATRKPSSDTLTRDEMYSITGMKTEMVPPSRKQIFEYLGINVEKIEMQKLLKENGGDTATSPSRS